MVAIIEKRQLRDFDWLTAFLAMAIVSFGVWQIYNAVPNESYWSKQIIGLVIAMVAMAVVAATDYRRIVDAAPGMPSRTLAPVEHHLTPVGRAVEQPEPTTAQARGIGLHDTQRGRYRDGSIEGIRCRSEPKT